MKRVSIHSFNCMENHSQKTSSLFILYQHNGNKRHIRLTCHSNKILGAKEVWMKIFFQILWISRKMRNFECLIQFFSYKLYPIWYYIYNVKLLDYGIYISIIKPRSTTPPPQIMGWQSQHSYCKCI